MILNLKNVNIDNKKEWSFVYDLEKYNENNRAGYFVTVIKNDDPLNAFNFVKTDLEDQYEDLISEYYIDANESDYIDLVSFIKNMNEWLFDYSLKLISNAEEYRYTVLVNYIDGNIGYDYYNFDVLPEFKEFKNKYLY